MKREIGYLLLFFFIGMSVLQVNAQTLISHTLEQDGKMMSVDEILESPSPVKLTAAVDKKGGEWFVYVLTNQGGYENIFHTKTYSDYCIIDPNSVPYAVWLKFKSFFIEEYNRDVFNFKISYTRNDGMKDSIYINWGLLPSRPELSNIKFDYTTDWDNFYVRVHGNFTFDIKSKDAVRYCLNLSPAYLFEFPGFFPFFEEYDAAVTDEIVYEADWGEYLAVQAINHFGFVWSDTLFTTFYIDDEAVLDRLDEIKALDINNSLVSQAKMFHWDNNIISFIKPVTQISVCDIAGKLIYSTVKTETIDLSNVPKGMYLVSYQFNSHFFNFKIYKT